MKTHTLSDERKTAPWPVEPKNSPPRAAGARRGGGGAALPWIVATVLCLGASDTDARRRGKEEPWYEEGAREVVERTYPAAFRDSLRAANAIGPNRGLREYEKYPFRRSERLVYDGGWGFITAGFAIMEARPSKKYPGLMSIEAKGFTNKFVSAFKKVRDYVHAWVDQDGFYPLFFEQHIHEEDYRDHRWTIYDHETGRVFTHKTKDSSTTASPFTHNWLSLLYYIRTLDYTPGDTFTVMCFVHEKDYPLHFRVLGREKIEVDAGTFTCLKIKPRLVGEGRGFTKRDEMYIWVTDDKRRMPVLVKAKAKLGHLWAQLVHYERD